MKDVQATKKPPAIIREHPIFKAIGTGTRTGFKPTQIYTDPDPQHCFNVA
jgi:hypothetical protein